VKPETVIGWHRKGFKLYWTSESRNRGGRPPIDAEIRTHLLISPPATALRCQSDRNRQSLDMV
jgi:hypothetical protein